MKLFLLIIDNKYRRIRRKYHDRKAADINIIKNYVREIVPSNYYKINQQLM